MTANVLEHRRAKAFADAVEDRPSTAAQQFTELLAAVDALDTLGSQNIPGLAPEVRTVQRAQLMAEFERAYAGGGSTAVPPQRARVVHRAGAAAGRFRPSTRWGRRLAVSGLAAGVVVSAFGGVAAASSSAIPGDPLYGVKRGLENWRLDFAGSDAERGRLLLSEASQRMTEAQQLVDRHEGSDHELSPHVIAEVTKALSDMNAEGTQGRNLLQAIYQQSHSLAPMQSLAGFASSQQRQLDALAPHLPSQADPEAGRVQQLLSGISEELAPLHLGGTTTSGSGSLSAPGTGSSSSVVGGAGSGSRSGQAAAPSGATTSGTGTMGGSAPVSTPSSTGGSGGSLVNGLTGVLGSGAAPSSSPSTPGSPDDSSPSAAPAPGSGVTMPPLLPGLLPALGLGLSGDGTGTGATG